MSKNTGGPAFPRAVSEDPHLRNCAYDAQEGMTLRAYIAAKVMAELVVHSGSLLDTDATNAVRAADALIAALEAS